MDPVCPMGSRASLGQGLCPELCVSSHGSLWAFPAGSSYPAEEPLSFRLVFFLAHCFLLKELDLQSLFLAFFYSDSILCAHGVESSLCS